jgi:hypothetical protein
LGVAIRDEGVKDIRFVAHEEPAAGFQGLVGLLAGFAPVVGVVKRFVNEDGVEGSELGGGVADFLHGGADEIEFVGQFANAVGFGAEAGVFDIDGIDGGADDMKAHLGEEIGSPTAAAGEFEDFCGRVDAEFQEAFGEEGKMPQVHGAEIIAPKWFAAALVEEKFVLGAWAGALVALGFVDFLLVSEGGGEEAFRVIGKDQIGASEDFLGLAEGEAPVFLILFPKDFTAVKQGGSCDLLSNRAGKGFVRRKSFKHTRMMRSIRGAR